MEFFKSQFQAIRHAKGLTLQQIADMIHVTKQTVQKWEKGNANPLPSHVIAMAKALRISVTDISDLRPEKEICQSPDEVIDADLGKIVSAWGDLTEEQRSALLATLEAFTAAKKRNAAAVTEGVCK